MDEKALSLTEGMLLIVMYLQVCVGVLLGTVNKHHTHHLQSTFCFLLTFW